MKENQPIPSMRKERLLMSEPQTIATFTKENSSGHLGTVLPKEKKGRSCPSPEQELPSIKKCPLSTKLQPHKNQGPRQQPPLPFILLQLTECAGFPFSL